MFGEVGLGWEKFGDVESGSVVTGVGRLVFVCLLTIKLVGRPVFTGTR